MAEEIEFSIMAPSAEGIRPLLEQFEVESGIRVRLRLMSWDSAWEGLVRAALYNDGPDVSEVGTTWIGDLVGMNALRPFNAAEVAAVGKAAAFSPSTWQSAMQYGDTRVWSIPWLAGARLIYYRPALFERAGIDPGTAFRSGEQLEETISRLKSAGIPVPWTVPTGFTHTTLLNIASWVWAAGGEFISADGRSIRFMEPAALEGMRAYFRLGRYLAPEVRFLNRLEPDVLFLENAETAVTISGPWLFCEARGRIAEGGRARMAVALPPGAPFVGGSNLVIWKYSRQAEAAVKWIRFLTRTASQVSYCQHIGLLPARAEALERPPFSSDPFWQIANRGLEAGRTFPVIRLWGLVEDRLTTVFSGVWAEVLASPELDPLVPLRKHLAPVAERLEGLLQKG
jgi:multiple sugar transport system substrate-binding protein